MSFLREMGNVVTSLAGSVLPVMGLNLVVKSDGIIPGIARHAVGWTGGYLGNKVIADKSPEEIKEIIRNRAVDLLNDKGLSLDEINTKFDQSYDPTPIKISAGRNIGNLITTQMGAVLGAGILGGIAGYGVLSATTKANPNAKPDEIILKMLEKPKNIVGTILASVAGTLLGGYLGNKAWQGPSKKAIDERAMDVVAKILAERKPAVEGMSQVEALQHREEQRAQSTEKVR